MRSTRPLILALAALGCTNELPPRGQIVLTIDTNAIVAPARGAPPDSMRLSPLVDRVRIEVRVDDRALPGSTRDFAVDDQMFREHKVSFGIAPAPGGAKASARVLLFRADRVTSERIEQGVRLESIVQLPPVAEEGIVEAFVVLQADDFGKIVKDVAPALGPPPPSVVGTWRGGKRVLCDEAPRAGEVCVPGGAFFFGTPEFRGRALTTDIS